MRLEEILKDPVNAGVELSDTEWEMHKEHILEAVTKDPLLSCEAGIRWKDYRYHPNKKQIVESVLEDPYASYKAGRSWKDDRINPIKSDIAGSIAQSPELSIKAVKVFEIQYGSKLPSECGVDYYRDMHFVKRFRSYITEFAEAALRSEQPNFDVFSLWDPRLFNHFSDEFLVSLFEKHWHEIPIIARYVYDEKFNGIADKIIDILVKHPDACYDAGREWKDGFFRPHANKIAEAVLKDPEASFKAFKGWREDRLKPYADSMIESALTRPKTLVRDLIISNVERMKTYMHKIAAAVAESSELSFKAGRYWDDALFDPAAKDLVRSVLRDPKQCYRAGKFWKKQRFDISADEIAARVADDPEASCLAGRYWNGERFFLCPDKIVDAVTKDKTYSVQAGITWNKTRFELYADRIAEAVAGDIGCCIDALSLWVDYRKQKLSKAIEERYGSSFLQNITLHSRTLIEKLDSKSAYFAGKDWVDEKFNLYSDTIAYTVAQDIDASYRAGRDWNDERFNKYADILAESVAKNPNRCYQAGLDWKDGRFSDKIIVSLAGDLEYSIKALSDWSEERKRKLASLFSPGFSKNLALIKRALGLAKEHGKVNNFTQGLKYNLKRNTEKDYCLYIITSLAVEGVGGEQYRI